MRLAYEMEYVHPVAEKSSLKMIRYSEQYRNEYKRIYNECYHPMREALDIRPYDYIQDDSFFDAGMDKVYLLANKNVIIGSVRINGQEIDDLIVNRPYQGLGFGKELLLWALEHIHAKRVRLHVAAWNSKAICLYQKTGFEITSSNPF